jgi:hypothetical protein
VLARKNILHIVDINEVAAIFVAFASEGVTVVLRPFAARVAYRYKVYQYSSVRGDYKNAT